jgi:hypothetical protein
MFYDKKRPWNRLNFLNFFIVYLLGGVILVGGQSGNTILKSLYELSGISGSWKEMIARLYEPRRYLVALTISDILVVDCTSGF